MMSSLAWPIATVASWLILYLAFIRPMLAKIRTTIGTTATIASPSTPWWKNAIAYVEGSKTVIVSCLVSLFTAAKSGVDALSQNTGILDEAKAAPWATFLTPDMALKAVGVIMFLVTALHLYGVLKAAKATPQA